jgi:hypothetical protein
LAQHEIQVRISDGRGVIAEEPPHAVDPDFHTAFRPRMNGDLTVELTGHGLDPDESVAKVEMTAADRPGASAVIAAQPGRAARSNSSRTSRLTRSS